MGSYSSFVRFFSWVDPCSEIRSVFYRCDDLIKDEIQLLERSLLNFSWNAFGGPEGETPPNIDVEPAISEEATRFLECFREYDTLLESDTGTWCETNRALHCEAKDIHRHILDCRRYGKVGRFLRVDVGNGPTVFGYLDTLTGEEFEALEAVLDGECHVWNGTFDSISEYDRIESPTAWAFCLHDYEVIDCLRDLNEQPHSTLWTIAHNLAASLTSCDDPDERDIIEEEPKWDGRKLMLGEFLVCELSGTAKNQRLILDSFEEQGWASKIDDPLPGGADSQRLRETIRSLNNRQDKLIFKADGTGKGIMWELRVCKP